MNTRNPFFIGLNFVTFLFFNCNTWDTWVVFPRTVFVYWEKCFVSNLDWYNFPLVANNRIKYCYFNYCSLFFLSWFLFNSICFSRFTSFLLPPFWNQLRVFTDSEVCRAARDTNRWSQIQSGKMLIALLFGLLTYSSWRDKCSDWRGWLSKLAESVITPQSLEQFLNINSVCSNFMNIILSKYCKIDGQLFKTSQYD